MLNFYVGDATRLPINKISPKLIYIDAPYNTSDYENLLTHTLVNIRSFILAETSWLVICVNYKRRCLAEKLVQQLFQTLKLHNEIIWSYNFGLYTRKKFVVSHDTLLVFKRGTPEFYWQQVSIPSQRLESGDPRGDTRGRTPGDVWDIPRKPGNDLSRRFMKDIYHRQSQPIELCERIVRAYTKYHDLVFDPFMGSGTMAKACHFNNRRYIGGDKVEGYVREVYGYFNKCL